MYQFLTLRRDGPVEYLTLNRPDVRNAFNDAVITELQRWADAVAGDAGVRVVVMAGAGKVFSAGADASWMARMAGYSREENERDARATTAMLRAINRLPVGVIGRIHGAALGGGAGLAAVCDIVVADAQTVFGFTETKLGILPAMISPFVLPKIGVSAARELFLTGMRFDAAKAKAIGLVHAVVEADALDATVQGYVTELLSAAPTAVAAAKALIPQVAGRTPEEVADLTAAAIAGQRASAEGQDGLRAFLDKRAPGWLVEMIRRVLIANRGEIALRVIRACRTAGIETVAVYSDADAGAPHVLAADAAVRIGPPPAAESYLNVAALIAAARSERADAVHPGYGFLSERAHFARAVEDAGLIFIGPSASVIERLGSKTGARRIMEAAGVPVVPGEASDDQSDAALSAAALRVGLPVLVKPAAGGGGIGMKVVREPHDLTAAVQQARREATAAFGNGTLYLERLIERPRHVEIQIVADHHGHTVHLFERECSAQRRHQKVVEETPCPALTPALRARMGAAGVAAAQAVGYENAGTVEFLLEGEGDDAHFYFLEINTRLQVEHPITECVVGVDLVQAQLEVASGRPLPWTQAELSQRGHAIECRVYAEAPALGFLPQAGPLLRYREPAGPGIRVDAGVVEGGEVSVFYDPLLAKLIVWGDSRTQALARATDALTRFEILGLHTNLAFLRAILAHDDFLHGRIDTGFLDRNLSALAAAEDGLSDAALAAAAWHAATTGATSAVGADTGRRPAFDPFDTIRGWRG